MIENSGKHDELVAQLYDSAISPERLEQLIDSWMSGAPGSVSAADFQLLAEPIVLGHIQRAERLLRQLIRLGEDDRDRAREWAETARAAAFVVNRAGIVLAANATARQTFGLVPGASISALPVIRKDLAAFSDLIEHLGSAMDTGARLLHLRCQDRDDPILARIVESIGGDADQVGVVTSMLAWSEKLATQLTETFQLTQAEADVLKYLTLGHSVKEIAELKKRFQSTIRSHVRGLLEKTNSRTQLDLVRVTLGLLDLVDHRAQIVPLRGPPGVSPQPNDYQTVFLADRRRLDYLAIGDPLGRPFLMLPSDGGFTRLPSKAEAWLAENHMLMIVPIRAGYGHSSPLPKRRNALEVAVADMLELCDQLRIARCPILAFCDDFHLAVLTACTTPARVSAIIGIGPTMPATEPKHFRRMPKWTRFVFANARYAPRTLPYIAMVLFLYMRKLGPRRFLQTALASSRADTRLLEDDELLTALLRGAEIAVGPTFAAHAAWAAGAIANYGADWSDKLAACPAPSVLYAGHQDPFAPIETTREFAAITPSVTLHEFADYGQLLYPLWPRFLAEVERRLGT